MKTQTVDLEKPSYWQLVFLQSKANGAAYNGDWLPGRNWNWPENTYLRRRLGELRRFRSPDMAEFQRSEQRAN